MPAGGRRHPVQDGCHAACARGGGDPPDPDQAGFVGTFYMVQVCKEHDPDPRRSLPIPRSRTSTPIGERPRR